MVADLGYAGQPGDGATMIPNARYQDTPSIIHDQITTVRAGRTLAYAELTGLEKRDYLFDRGIRPTSYENYRDEGRPDVVSGFVQFSKSALESFANHLLSESLTRVSDELEEPKPKLFHTYGTTAKIAFIPEQGTPYTGVLRENVPGLARFSFAGPVGAVGGPGPRVNNIIVTPKAANAPPNIEAHCDRRR
jgi:hypothetical protein